MLKYGIKYNTGKGQRMVGFRTLKAAKVWGYRRMAKTGERFEIITL